MHRLPVLALALGAACAPSARGSRSAPVFQIPFGLDRHRPVPESNPLTSAKVALGRRLFFDAVLSTDRSVACASCHNPTHSFSDGRPVSVGVYGRRGRRNVPALINRAYGRTFFWDGRGRSLEEQVLQPIEDSLEMGLPLDDAIARLRRSAAYDAEFRNVFGGPPTAPRVAASLASYVRTIVSGNSRFDLWTRGDSTALTLDERAGLALFRGKANCGVCHVAPTFTDEQFHNTGVARRQQEFTDSGRYLVTRAPRDLGAFKTPTLRDVARTAPYMHDGSLPTLDEVIEFYDRGGSASRLLDPQVRPLNLSREEKRALAAFLRSLNGSK